LKVASAENHPRRHRHALPHGQNKVENEDDDEVELEEDLRLRIDLDFFRG
jgi:hypothetical protein